MILSYHHNSSAAFHASVPASSTRRDDTIRRYGQLDEDAVTPSPGQITRSKAIFTSLMSTAALLFAGSMRHLPYTSRSSLIANAADDSIAAKHQIDYSTFQKNIFQKPPGVIQYPEWMEGEWETTWQFIGADFPSSVRSSSTKAFIPKDRIIDDTTLPGFRRLSIVMTPDVGRAEVKHKMRFKRVEGEGGVDRIEEDRAYNIQQALDAELGNGGVNDIEYEPSKNPNRASLSLFPGISPNARRIELFWNFRSILPSNPADRPEDQGQSFRYAEDVRQVMITPSLAETTTVGDYRHVWEFYQDKARNGIKGYLSTIAYATPQDPLFQSGVFQPLVAYFHTLYLSH